MIVKPAIASQECSCQLPPSPFHQPIPPCILQCSPQSQRRSNQAKSSSTLVCHMRNHSVYTASKNCTLLHQVLNPRPFSPNTAPRHTFPIRHHLARNHFDKKFVTCDIGCRLKPHAQHSNLHEDNRLIFVPFVCDTKTTRRKFESRASGSGSHEPLFRKLIQPHQNGRRA